MAENICKGCSQQGISLQNLQTVPTAQYQRKKQLNQKMVTGPKKTFFQRRHTDGQETHENMLNMANY